MDYFVSSDIARSEWLTHLMNEYGDRLTKLAYTYVKDVGKAQEIVQDVFVTCYEQYEKVRQIEKIKPWLYRVTINRAKDVLRSTWVKRVLLHNALAHEQITSNLTEETILQNDEQTTLFHMILALPVKYREVILLFYYEDCSIDDIANTLVVEVCSKSAGRSLMKMEDKLRSIKNNPNLLTDVTFTEQNKQNVHRRLTNHKNKSFSYSVVTVVFTITMVIGLFYLLKPTETIIDSTTPQKLPTLAVTGEQYTIEWLYDAMDRGNHDFSTNVHGALIVDPTIKTFARGQVAYYQLPDTNNEDNMYISRIVGLPGETIEIKDGHVWIDNKKLEAFYAVATRHGLTEEAYFETMNPENITNEPAIREYFHTNMEAITLKENEYFVLVDQWWRGTDSRTIGPIQHDSIEGIVIGHEE